MGIEPITPAYISGGIPMPAIYPTGPALVEALKGKLVERGYCCQFMLSPKGCGVSIWKYGIASTGIFEGKATTELDALLAACDAAFCGE